MSILYDICAHCRICAILWFSISRRCSRQELRVRERDSVDLSRISVQLPLSPSQLVITSSNFPTSHKRAERMFEVLMCVCVCVPSPRQGEEGLVINHISPTIIPPPCMNHVRTLALIVLPLPSYYTHAPSLLHTITINSHFKYISN